MKKENRNEGLQSRRKFFKKAAKGALPILGAFMLARTPLLLRDGEMGGIYRLLAGEFFLLVKDFLGKVALCLHYC